MFPPFSGPWPVTCCSNAARATSTAGSCTPSGCLAPFNINSVWGIVFVEISIISPFVFMQVVSAPGAHDPTLEECARIAGARQMRLIRKITLPLVLPAIFRRRAADTSSPRWPTSACPPSSASPSIFTCPPRSSTPPARRGQLRGHPAGAPCHTAGGSGLRALIVQKRVLSAGQL